MKEAISALGAAAAAAFVAVWGWRKKRSSKKQKRDRVVNQPKKFSHTLTMYPVQTRKARSWQVVNGLISPIIHATGEP